MGKILEDKFQRSKINSTGRNLRPNGKKIKLSRRNIRSPVILVKLVLILTMDISLGQRKINPTGRNIRLTPASL